MLKVIFSNNTLTQLQSDLAQILNLMNPVSVELGDYRDRYTAKAILEHEGRYDETSMEILSKGARLKDAFCATCDVFAYDLDEKGDPTHCYMFKKPTSYDCSAYPDRIRVEIEFGELHHGPNIDEECKEIETARYYMETLRNLIKDDLNEKFNNPGDDNMKQLFAECIGECITCAAHGHCLAGIGDDDYVVADKAELIRRLNHDDLADGYKTEIKRVLKKEYGYDYDEEINNIKATTRIRIRSYKKKR